jgi:hypothetical protein
MDSSKQFHRLSTAPKKTLSLGVRADNLGSKTRTRVRGLFYFIRSLLNGVVNSSEYDDRMVGFVDNELGRNYPGLISDTIPRGKTEENQETPQSGEPIFEPRLVLRSFLTQVGPQYIRPRR